MTDRGPEQPADRMDPDLDVLVGELYRWRRETSDDEDPVAQDRLRDFLIANEARLKAAATAFRAITLDDMKRRQRADRQLDLPWPADSWVGYIDVALDHAHRVLDARQQGVDVSTVLSVSDDRVNMMTRVLNQAKYATDTTGLGAPTPLADPRHDQQLSDRLIRLPRAKHGIDGYAFKSSGEPGSDIETRLLAIQSELADPDVPIDLGAHLNMYSVATIAGPTVTRISLWVPGELEASAVELLESAGFEIERGPDGASS